MASGAGVSGPLYVGKDTRALFSPAMDSVLEVLAGNGAPIGGLKVTTANGWFAARPSGTDTLCKIYAESFVDEEHLERIWGRRKFVFSETWRSERWNERVQNALFIEALIRQQSQPS